MEHFEMGVARILISILSNEFLKNLAGWCYVEQLAMRIEINF